MMTQQLQVSILTAPVGAIDPRALSQAWYSALRLARDGKPERCFASPRSDEFNHIVGPARLASSQAHVKARAAFVSTGRSRRGSAPIPSGDAAPERMGMRSSLARRIERAFAESRLPQRRATFSLGHGTARVHVILQTNGDRSALVALCRPDLEPLVSRALAAACQALAARGIAGRLHVRTVGRCS